MKKRLISGLLSAVMAINVITVLPPNAFALGSESRIYEKDDYTVTYRIGEEWDSNRSVEVTIENTGEESILNWALKYDVGGELYNLWNSSVYDSTDEYSIIKNNGYNYEIEPGESANYGYIVKGDETVIPEDIELCSRRVDVKSGYNVDFTVADDWNTGFTASVTLTNTSAEPIEAWTLLFDGNFDIKDIWGAKLLSSEERSYETAAEQWTNPIASGSSITFGFTADKSATENANAENFALTAVIVGESSLVYPDFTDEDFEYIDYELDSDSDGLPDYYENIIGTDKDNNDTDVDGLTDGYEEFSLDTDPLKPDTDGNGVNDGDEDPDTDGLSNINEYSLNTSPLISDSDEDGLNDGDEVNSYGTNPLKFDSDDDGISDGDEIALGLDPNNTSTNGMPDGEHTFSQVVSADSENLSEVNENEEAPFDISLEVTAAGVAENNVYARESGYSSVIENSAIVGIAPEIIYTDGLSVEELTVKFELEDSVISNTLGTYSEEGNEFEGIKRLNIFMYFEDANMLLPVETFHDEVSSTVYTKTDRMGTYCLVDMEIFLANLESEMTESSEVETNEAKSKNSIDNDAHSSACVSQLCAKSNDKDNFDVVFLIDCRDVASPEAYATIQKNIIETADSVFIKSPNARVKIIEMLSMDDKKLNGMSQKVITRKDIGDAAFPDSDYFYNIDEVYSALEYIANDVYSGRTDCNISDAVKYVYESYGSEKRDTYVFCIVQTKRIFFQWKSDNGYDCLNDIQEEELPINISTIFSNEHISKYGYALDMSIMTGGMSINHYESSSVHMLEHIYKSDAEIKNGYKAIIGTGYKTVQLESSLQQNYEWYLDNSTNVDDLDGDGLYDYQEIMFTVQDGYPWSLINTDDPENVSLYTYQEIRDIIAYSGGDELFYVLNGLERYKSATGETYSTQINSLMKTQILPIKSDPTSEDGDNDAILDINDGYSLVFDNFPDLFKSMIESDIVDYDNIMFVNSTNMICNVSLDKVYQHIDITKLEC